jgi:tRNA(Ser,Leu) C12 N-acetylase TAN1
MVFADMIRHHLLKSQQYAIRPTIRNHSTLKRDAVIKLVASLISSHHKVDLTKPDKVIIVEIYQVNTLISINPPFHHVKAHLTPRLCLILLLSGTFIC